MNTLKKLFGLIAILTLLVFSVSAVSSALSISANPSQLDAGHNQTTLTVTNDVATTVSITSDPITGLTIAQPTLEIPAVGLSNSTLLTLTGTSNFIFGPNTVATITATDNANLTNTETETITFLQTFCKAGKVGDLKIKDVKIDNLGEGKDNEWQLLDEIEIEVEVENTNQNKNIDDIFVELALFVDSDGNNIISDLDFENDDEEEIEIGKLNNGKKEIVTFKFKVPADFEAGTNYMLAVKAYSEDEGEENQCADISTDLDQEYYQEISVERETDEEKFITFDNIRISPSQVTCGDLLTLTADVYNIGDQDLEDQIRVNLEISELGISLSETIRKDLDEGDRIRTSFTFTMPENAEDKVYQIELTADYDYRSSSDTYRESSGEATQFPLPIIGCSITPPVEDIALIKAVLDSDAKAGKELIVTTTVTNLMSASGDFVISVTDFESWASLVSISERVVTIGGGSTKEITITLDVANDAEGEKTFTIEARAGDKTESREVRVNIAPAGTSGINFGDNTLIWVIGIVNVVLIILIVIVAVRLSRR